MFGQILTLFSAGLSLWSSKEKTKYSDKLISLRKEYYEEYNKPLEHRNHAELDRLEFELWNLASGWAASVGKPDVVA